MIMTEYTDECCGCAVPGYPCIGESCSYKHVRRYFCDQCGEEIVGEPHNIGGLDICDECYKKEEENTMPERVIEKLQSQIEKRENDERAAELYKEKQYNYGFQNGLKYAIHAIEEEMNNGQ